MGDIGGVVGQWGLEEGQGEGGRGDERGPRELPRSHWHRARVSKCRQTGYALIADNDWIVFQSGYFSVMWIFFFI